MIDLASLQRRDEPFTHWVGDGLLDTETVREINAEWPEAGDLKWRVEGGSTVARKASMLFPLRLPPVAQDVAKRLQSPGVCGWLGELAGMDLHTDPWFLEGPEVPRLGGGLHEIGAGGMLGIHVDFERHPAGLCRVANLLVYLNEDWNSEWGGALELHGHDDVAAIDPLGGRAVFFVTTPDSWHGHPYPLRCPPERSRRSLAIYYYAETDGPNLRPKTVYRKVRRCA